MMMALGFPEVMASFGGAVILVFGICVVGWAGYCITSIARAADALERIDEREEKRDEERKQREEDLLWQI